MMSKISFLKFYFGVKAADEGILKAISSSIMEVKEKLQVAFRQNVVGLLTDLIDCYNLGNQKSEIIAFRVLVENDMPLETLLKKFYKYVYPFRQQIKDRNIGFFVENDKLFAEPVFVENPHICVQWENWKQIFLSNKLSANDLELLFRYFDLMIKCCENYVKANGGRI